MIYIERNECTLKLYKYSKLFIWLNLNKTTKDNIRCNRMLFEFCSKWIDVWAIFKSAFFCNGETASSISFTTEIIIWGVQRSSNIFNKVLISKFTAAGIKITHVKISNFLYLHNTFKCALFSLVGNIKNGFDGFIVFETIWRRAEEKMVPCWRVVNQIYVKGDKTDILTFWNRYNHYIKQNIHHSRHMDIDVSSSWEEWIKRRRVWYDVVTKYNILFLPFDIKMENGCS